MTGARILVIDDSTTVRKLVEIAMRGSGVEIDFAATGSEGVAQARAVPPDVILLDFLLPDLASVEVCQQLAEELSTSSIPVIVMSANQPSVFAAFQRFPTVIDFVGKPFAPAEIKARLEAALGGRPEGAAPRRRRGTIRPTGAPGQAALPTVLLATATKSLREVLLPRFAQLVGEAGEGAAEAYIDALLAPETVAGIVAACGGLAPARPVEGDLQLRGDLMSTPLLEVLRLLASASVTGTLVIELTDLFRIHVRRGGVLMCTTSRFDEGSLGSTRLASIPTGMLDHARRQQRMEGKPALVTLAQLGAARVADLPAELHGLGSKLLAELLGSTAGRFTWQPSVTLPDYVDAFGRHLSVTSIALGRQRQSPDAVLPPVFLDEVYDRTPRFSEKLGGTHLSGDEQRLLALIDGRYTVREVLGRAEISSERAAAIFSRLRNVDLIRSEALSGVAEVSGGAIAVLDADEEGFVGPMRAHFARRQQPIDVISLSRDQDLGAAVLRLRPRMVMFNTNLVPIEVISRELAPISRAGTIGLTAVIDQADRALVATLLAAGVHAVLAKPIHINEVERFISL